MLFILSSMFVHSQLCYQHLRVLYSFSMFSMVPGLSSLLCQPLWIHRQTSKHCLLLSLTPSLFLSLSSCRHIHNEHLLSLLFIRQDPICSSVWYSPWHVLLFLFLHRCYWSFLAKHLSFKTNFLVPTKLYQHRSKTKSSNQ